MGVWSLLGVCVPLKWHPQAYVLLVGVWSLLCVKWHPAVVAEVASPSPCATGGVQRWQLLDVEDTIWGLQDLSGGEHTQLLLYTD